MESLLILFFMMLFFAMGTTFLVNGVRYALILITVVRTKTTKIGQVLANHWEFKETIVELNGRAIKEAPIKAPYTEQECVFYRQREIAVFQRLDSKKKRMVHHYKVLLDRNSGESFYLEDNTGKVLVNPENFELDLVTTRDSARAPTYKEQNRCGELALNHGKLIKVNVIEEIIPLNRNLYVIGRLEKKFDDFFIASGVNKLAVPKIDNDQRNFTIDGKLKRTPPSAHTAIISVEGEAKVTKTHGKGFVWNLTLSILSYLAVGVMVLMVFKS